MHFETVVPLKYLDRMKETGYIYLCQFFKFGEQSEAENLKQVKYTWKF